VLNSRITILQNVSDPGWLIETEIKFHHSQLVGEGIDVRLLNKGVSTIIQTKLLWNPVAKDLKKRMITLPLKV
jgi:hypothetical protein